MQGVEWSRGRHMMRDEVGFSHCWHSLVKHTLKGGEAAGFSHCQREA